jgi:4-hydroxybenzoate polyprenyltransferase
VTTPAAGASEGADRTLNVFRRVGYHLLPGDAFSYLLHMRPAEWPIMAAHTALGFVLAVGLRPLGHGEGVGEGLWALFLWVVMLNGGTLAINSVFDRDEGDIGYLDKPPRPPTYLLSFSLGLMAAGQLLAFSLGSAFALAYAVCFAMSLAYSVPPLRLKAVGGVDWLINMVGFGTLTPYAGWAATARPLDHAHALVLLGFCPLFAALYPLTQLYQFEEDRRRGDRTLAIMLGMKRSLLVAIVCTLIAFAMFTSAVGASVSWRDAGIPIALAMWLLLLFRWFKRHATMPPVEHKRGMYAALLAWAVTDAAILLAFAL